MERQYTECDVWTMILMRVIIAYCVAISNMPPQDGLPSARPILTFRVSNRWRGRGLVIASAN